MPQADQPADDAEVTLLVREAGQFWDTEKNIVQDMATLKFGKALHHKFDFAKVHFLTCAWSEMLGMLAMLAACIWTASRISCIWTGVWCVQAKDRVGAQKLQGSKGL